MALTELMTTLLSRSPEDSGNPVIGSNGVRIRIYQSSVRMLGNEVYFMGREGADRYLYVVAIDGNGVHTNGFDSQTVPDGLFGSNLRGRRCPLTHSNAVHLRELFAFTRPVVLGIADSFGFGDRLGIANPAHIRSLEGSHMRPILAQQSIRELDRTGRTADEVLDAASWAVFQEGFTKGFGADADHLKTTDDIDRYANAGFTMYTFDPSAYVVNEAATLPFGQLSERVKSAETGDLCLKDLLDRYANKTFRIGEGLTLEPSAEDITRALIKYGGVITHTAALYKHLVSKHSSLQTEVELSVDETDIPTTPTEHLFIAGELKRLGVKWVSLAPRFIGDFEKGVDYRGDLNAFTAEYRRHVGISQLFGPYKISIHSGSDKFGVYRCIGSLHLGNVHVKTAGTSYLEALRTVAMVEPNLVREILGFSRDRYEVDRATYHVTGQLSRVPTPEACTDKDLVALFDQHDARQVFHVTFGKVLSTKDDSGRSLFRDRLLRCLNENETVHYDNLIKHFKKHLDPFKLD